MRGSSAWITAASAYIQLALLALPASAEVVVRQELASGRSMAVFVRSVDPFGEEPPGMAESVRTRLVAELEKRKRFRVVEDPSQADLVCLYVLYAPWQEGRQKVALTVGSSIIIFKGGAGEGWDAAPLWMRTDHPAVHWAESLPQLVGSLHREVEKGRPQQRPPVPQESADPSTETTVFMTCLEPRSCKSAEAMLPAAGPRWNRVDDPSRADYVVVWFNTASLGAFVLFRGDQPDWAKPLHGFIAPEAAKLREPLEKMIAYLADARAPNISTKLSAPEPGRATLYIARDNDPVVKSIALALDGETVLDLETLTYVQLTVPAGAHIISAWSDRNRAELPLYTSADTVYFVLVAAQRGSLSSRVTLKQVDRIDLDRVLLVLARDF